MSLGKKLMGMFIESAETEEAKDAPSASEPSKAEAAQSRTVEAHPAPRSGSAPAPAIGGSGESDPTLVEALRKTLRENNLPGFDYLEFEASLKALETVIPDEGVRFRSAFATAMVQGMTLEILSKTSQSYRDLLVNERGQFEADLKAKQDTDVAKRKDEIDSLAKDIQTKADQVGKLTEEIAAAQEKHRKLEAQAQKSAAALDRARTRFLASLASVDEEIARNQSKIKTYLGGT